MRSTLMLTLSGSGVQVRLTPTAVYAIWRTAVERSLALVAQVVAERGLDGPASLTWAHDRTPTVRDMLLDMVEEYTQHTGHADVVREAIDGRVGEGAPQGFRFRSCC